MVEGRKQECEEQRFRAVPESVAHWQRVTRFRRRRRLSSLVTTPSPLAATVLHVDKKSLHIPGLAHGASKASPFIRDRRDDERFSTALPLAQKSNEDGADLSLCCA